MIELSQAYRELRDPRYFQIISLSCFIALQYAGNSFGPQPAALLAIFPAAILTQYVCSRIVNIRFEAKSALITACSLTLLLKAGAPYFLTIAAIMAIASKFMIRDDNGHIFNPANFAIVVMLVLLPDSVWISPGQWGANLWVAFLIACLAFLVLFQVPRRDMALLFLGCWLAMIFGRAFWLGDPWSIPVNQLQNGSLLIFAFFMISDPKTIPRHFYGRIIFALAVSLTGYILQFVFHVNAGLFYALAMISMVRPFIDRVFQAAPYHWKPV